MKESAKQFDQPISEEQLQSLLSRSKESALRALYDRYWEGLYLQTYTVLGDGPASEDVVQEVFIDLWEKRKFNRIEDLSAYLYQAVKYKTLMAIRHNKINDRHLEIFKELNPTHAIDHELEVRELHEAINHHLTRLPPRCREVFYKSRFEHLKNDEIAEQLNISKRTVETHISHALRHLKGVKELLVFILWMGW